ncbi:UNVERIFIED_CONTAM: hypothetical protein GTU68_066882, partial [Idotea baltica]|nr:hypothetical protein [Idotea baltica]
MKSELRFIGRIITPYKKLEECPNNIQIEGAVCKIELYDEYKEGLFGLAQGQEILVLYWLEHANRNKIQQASSAHNDACVKGTFALRSPHRPNPIGVATLLIESLEAKNGKLTVRGLDCLDDTQLIDIKP